MVTDIVFSSEEINLGIDDTETIVADVLPEDADNKTLRWSSDSPSIVSVTVDEDTYSATVKGVSEGEAIITAAATDGSGVSAMCNVVVSGDKPYPENANYYVKSVQGYKLNHYSEGSAEYSIYTFVNSNNENICVVPVGTSASSSGFVPKIQVINYDTGEVLDEHVFSSSSERYIIGSLKDKSYMQVKAPSFYSSWNASTTSYIYYDNKSSWISSDLYCRTFSGETGDRRRASMTLAIEEYNIRRAYNCTGEYTYCSLHYFKQTSNSYRTSLYTDYMYDEVYRNQILYSNLGISENENCLFKINVIRNGIKVSEDYWWLVREGTHSITEIKQSKLKLQNKDGTYSYINGAGELITPEEFPDGEEITYEFTLNLDLT